MISLVVLMVIHLVELFHRMVLVLVATTDHRKGKWWDLYLVALMDFQMGYCLDKRLDLWLDQM